MIGISFIAIIVILSIFGCFIASIVIRHNRMQEALKADIEKKKIEELK